MISEAMSKAADCVLALFAVLFLAMAAIGLVNSDLDSRLQLLIALGASGLVLGAIVSRRLLRRQKER